MSRETAEIAQPTWSTVILSNVLLTVPVTFSFMVVGWVGGGVVAPAISSNDLLPGVNADSDVIRLVLTACMALAGFVISQVCFVARYSERGDRAWRLVPFGIRFSLGSIFAVSLAAAVLLWFNVSENVSKSSIEVTTSRGWPNDSMHVSVQKIADFNGPVSPLPPATVTFNWVVAIFNAAVCLDLLFVVLVVVETLIPKRKRDPTTDTAPADLARESARPDAPSLPPGTEPREDPSSVSVPIRTQN